MRDELLDESTPEKLHLHSCKCPNIKIDINDIQTYALVDSGSEVTAISEEFFNSNEKLKNCPKLPLNGKIVKGALGSKTMSIKFQILCSVKIGNNIEEIIFLIIPKLGRNCIIGYDTIKDLSMIIDPINEVLNLQKSGTTIGLVQPEDFTNSVCENHFLTIKCIETDHYSFYYDEEDDSHQPINSSITREEIDDKLKDNENLSDSEKIKLGDLLFDYKSVFERKPGLVQDFEYDLIVENDKPFHVKPYPIPLKYQDKVELELQNMLKNGIIRRSKSNFINPVVIVAKKMVQFVCAWMPAN